MRGARFPNGTGVAIFPPPAPRGRTAVAHYRAVISPATRMHVPKNPSARPFTK